MTGLSPIQVDTHEQRLAALKAYPRWLKYAMDGNQFHASWVWETHVAFAALAFQPWKWLD